MSYLTGAALAAPAAMAATAAAMTRMDDCFMLASPIGLPEGRGLELVFLLAAGALGLEAALDQLLDQPVAMVALDLDATVVDRAARAALLLQLGGERGQLVGRQAEPADHRDALALAALRFAADPHDAIARG